MTTAALTATGRGAGRAAGSRGGAGAGSGCDLPSSRAGGGAAERYSHVYAAAGIHPRTAQAFRTPIWRRCGSCWRSRRWQPSARSGWTTTGRKIPQRLPADGIPQAAGAGGGAGSAGDRPRPGGPRRQPGDRIGVPRGAGRIPLLLRQSRNGGGAAEAGLVSGFDGPVTYKNARRAPEVVAVTPLDRIVVETDAPT